MMPMFYRLLADAVVLLHFAFVVFVALGGLLVLRSWRFAWLHLPAAAWGVFVEFYLHYCPLTPLENWLRARGGGDAYAGGFIAHYVSLVIYPPGLSPAMQAALGVLLVAGNILVYGIAWRRRRPAG